MKDHIYKSGQVFVFGSNYAGRHGKGAALDALTKYGAIYGQGEGLQGSSYAIPTKDRWLKTLPLDVVHGHVKDFIQFATNSPHLSFFVTRIGCGLAGYRDEEIAWMFKRAPANCDLPTGWRELAKGGE